MPPNITLRVTQSAAYAYSTIDVSFSDWDAAKWDWIALTKEGDSETGEKRLGYEWTHGTRSVSFELGAPGLYTVSYSVDGGWFSSGTESECATILK